MSKIITYDELKANTTKDSVYLLIDKKVYNCTQFLDEHPGGDEVILAESGKDATEAFEDVGHSDEAREILAGLFLGDFDVNSGLDLKSGSSSSSTGVSTAVEQGSNMMYFVPLALLGAYFGFRFYSTGAI